ncbi:hypothetical protein F5Y03DRAFT_82015 [Xylaria venustula]|nr:hypothetical protein F5Y03DRAFT_82015 [Xylaria venustula]
MFGLHMFILFPLLSAIKTSRPCKSGLSCRGVSWVDSSSPARLHCLNPCPCITHQPPPIPLGQEVPGYLDPVHAYQRDRALIVKLKLGGPAI